MHGGSQLDLRELQRVRERRIVVACGQASRVGRATEGRGHTLYCGSASRQPADGLLGAHGLNPRELCGDGRQTVIIPLSTRRAAVPEWRRIQRPPPEISACGAGPRAAATRQTGASAPCEGVVMPRRMCKEVCFSQVSQGCWLRSRCRTFKNQKNPEIAFQVLFYS